MDHQISRETAESMIALYRRQRENILKPEYQGKDILVYSETFQRKAFDLLLNKPGLTAIRIYFGMSEDLKIHAIIVGVDNEGRDVFMKSAEPDPEDGEEDIILEEAVRCPPVC